jgi:L-asparaginase / beta-aspartyl-peptidase
MRKIFLILFTSLLTNLLFSQIINDTMKNFVLVIHGGAGTILKKNMTPEKEAAYREKLTEALQTGHDVLKNGGTSEDAVQAAIMVMEDSPLFNAGKGSVYTNKETNEMDAAFMDGKTLKAGAIAGVRTIKNPIVAARTVKDQSEHVMLVGEGAEQFAASKGVVIVDTTYFFDQNRLNQLRDLKEKEKMILDHDSDGGWVKPDSSEIEFNVDLNPEKKFGTVGAVALDQYGNLAAGTSTGGMTNKKFGRVGDAPIIGAGTYANNNTCAVSCTGHGEYFMRNVVAYDVSAMMEYKNVSLEEAAKEIVNVKLEKQDGRGGLIAVDAKGNFTMPFNTDGMYRGYVKSDGTIHVFIYKGEE